MRPAGRSDQFQSITNCERGTENGPRMSGTSISEGRSQADSGRYVQWGVGKSVTRLTIEGALAYPARPRRCPLKLAASGQTFVLGRSEPKASPGHHHLRVGGRGQVEGSEGRNEAIYISGRCFWVEYFSKIPTSI